MKKVNILTITFLSLILFASVLASAADVAYIYKNPFKIDDNVLTVFSELGLTVDLISEKTLPENFDSYKLLFIGDENLRNKNQIPVNDYPVIIASYYHADTWGLTDNEGVSQLGSTAPLSIIQGDTKIQVYTAPFLTNRIAIPYYFLDKQDKLQSLQQIAATQTTSSGYKFGDVISYADEGTQMLNGKTQKGNLCFFGIIKSDYWTPEAKNLFKNCVNFAAAECIKDTDCPADEISEPFCQDNNVSETITSYACEANACVPETITNLLETCDYGCDAGQCLSEPQQEQHDVSLIDFPDAVNNIRISDELNNVILGNELNCSEQYKFEIKVENTGDFTENVSFIGSVGSLELNHNPILNFESGEITTTPKSKTISSLTLAEGYYNITIQALIDGFSDANPDDNIATREIFVSCA